MDDEFVSLIEKKTWDLVNFPPRRKLVQYKWTYKKTKIENDGTKIKYKDLVGGKWVLTSPCPRLQ